MSTPLIINGVTFQYPQQGDKNWGPTLTNWSSAVTSGMLQKAGGSFTLTAEVDFGGSFGMKVLSIKSEESNIATTGILRLANASTGIVWRNAAHNADLALTVNASNQLTFNGTSIGATTALTNSHILVGDVSNQPADVAMSGDIAITNAGVTSIGAGKVLDANVGSAAAIALSKLAASTGYSWYVANTSGVLTPQTVTASRAVATDANGLPVASATTATQLGYLSTTTSDVQTQITAKVSKSGDTMSGVLNMGSNKIVSLAQGTASGNAAAYDQLPAVAGTITNWAALAGMTVSGFGTIANSTFLYRRVGDTIQVRGTFTAGTTAATSASINLPTVTVDTAKMATNINSSVGVLYNITNTLQTYYSTGGALILFFDQSDNTKLYCAAQSSSNSFVKATGSAAATSSTNLTFYFEVPITGWSI